MHFVSDQQGRRSRFRDPVIVHISGTLVTASQPLLLNCLLMFTDVCPQVVLFSPITDSTKNTLATQRLQWNLVDVAILVFRQPTDHIAGLQQGLDLMIMICLRLMNFLAMLPIWRIVL